MTDRDNITLPREVVEKALEALGEETAWFGPTPKGAAAITALRTALAAQTYELDPSIRLKGLEIALADCKKSHELTAKKYMDTLSENERLKEQMKRWMKAGVDNDITR